MSRTPTSLERDQITTNVAALLFDLAQRLPNMTPEMLGHSAQCIVESMKALLCCRDHVLEPSVKIEAHRKDAGIVVVH